MKRRIKDGTTKFKLDVLGICPYCKMLVGNVYKTEEDGSQTLLGVYCKYQSSAIEITVSEIKDLKRLNCATGNCVQKTSVQNVAVA